VILLKEFTPTRLQRFVLVSLIALGPPAVVWWLKVVVFPAEYWMRPDPQVAYFFSGLRLLSGKAPLHNDHPGTPVQVVSAAIAGLTGAGPLDAERFLRLANVVSLLAFVATWALLYFALIESLPARLVFLPMSILSVSPHFFHVIALWGTDVWLFPAAVLIIVSWIRLFRSRNAPVKGALLAGLAVGAAVALKVTFLPMALGGAAALLVREGTSNASRARGAAAYGTGILGGFGVATLPIWTRYPEMASWLMRLAFHQGTLGSGEVGFPAVRDYLLGLMTLITSSRMFTVTAIIALVYLTSALLRIGNTTLSPSIACGMLTSIALSYLMVAKQPDPRYLIPAAGFVGVAWIFISNEWLRRVDPRIATLLSVMVLLLGIRGASIELRWHRSFVASQRRAMIDIDQYLAGHREIGQRGPILWSSDRPAYALRYGDWYAGGIFGKSIDSVYPNDGFFPNWDPECNPSRMLAVTGERERPREFSAAIIRDDDWDASACVENVPDRTVVRAAGHHIILNRYIWPR
jgi:hypothetical protein